MHCRVNKHARCSRLPSVVADGDVLGFTVGQFQQEGPWKRGFVCCPFQEENLFQSVEGHEKAHLQSSSELRYWKNLWNVSEDKTHTHIDQ